MNFHADDLWRNLQTFHPLSYICVFFIINTLHVREWTKNWGGVETFFGGVNILFGERGETNIWGGSAPLHPLPLPPPQKIRLCKGIKDRRMPLHKPPQTYNNKRNKFEISKHINNCVLFHLTDKSTHT